jgi:hypothetical protein
MLLGKLDQLNTLLVVTNLQIDPQNKWDLAYCRNLFAQMIQRPVPYLTLNIRLRVHHLFLLSCIFILDIIVFKKK